MVRFVLSLAVLAGLAYGGLYFYYDASLTRAVDDRLDGLGLTAVEVKGIDFAPTAPLVTDTHVTAGVVYRSAEASLDIRVIGHPVFSEEYRLELDSLQAFRLSIGAGE
ncbi:hypothetical protein RSO68_13690 [Halomonas saccharevitans]|uniref:Uncharacterized protein n=1 Tax=Halomonas saccharevitans TaxID=416872 RepID=A0ABU3NH74_9GAMM|nr:hypothetical protein [Halomonas saccharevitans]MDT8880525.1 hypothetical protein [Halomonas saccharevitans]